MSSVFPNVCLAMTFMLIICCFVSVHNATSIPCSSGIKLISGIVGTPTTWAFDACIIKISPPQIQITTSGPLTVRITNSVLTGSNGAYPIIQVIGEGYPLTLLLESTTIEQVVFSGAVNNSVIEFDAVTFPHFKGENIRIVPSESQPLLGWKDTTFKMQRSTLFSNFVNVNIEWIAVFQNVSFSFFSSNMSAVGDLSTSKSAKNFMFRVSGQFNSSVTLVLENCSWDSSRGSVNSASSFFVANIIFAQNLTEGWTQCNFIVSRSELKSSHANIVLVQLLVPQGSTFVLDSTNFEVYYVPHSSVKQHDLGTFLLIRTVVLLETSIMFNEVVATVVDVTAVTERQSYLIALSSATKLQASTILLQNSAVTINSSHSVAIGVAVELSHFTMALHPDLELCDSSIQVHNSTLSLFGVSNASAFQLSNITSHPAALSGVDVDVGFRNFSLIIDKGSNISLGRFNSTAAPECAVVVLQDVNSSSTKDTHTSFLGFLQIQVLDSQIASLNGVIVLKNVVWSSPSGALAPELMAIQNCSIVLTSTAESSSHVAVMVLQSVVLASMFQLSFDGVAVSALATSGLSLGFFHGENSEIIGPNNSISFFNVNYTSTATGMNAAFFNGPQLKMSGVSVTFQNVLSDFETDKYAWFFGTDEGAFQNVTLVWRNSNCRQQCTGVSSVVYFFRVEAGGNMENVSILLDNTSVTSVAPAGSTRGFIFKYSNMSAITVALVNGTQMNMVSNHTSNIFMYFFNNPMLDGINFYSDSSTVFNVTNEANYVIVFYFNQNVDPTDANMRRLNITIDGGHYLMKSAYYNYFMSIFKKRMVNSSIVLRGVKVTGDATLQRSAFGIIRHSHLNSSQILITDSSQIALTTHQNTQWGYFLKFQANLFYDTSVIVNDQTTILVLGENDAFAIGFDAAGTMLDSRIEVVNVMMNVSATRVRFLNFGQVQLTNFSFVLRGGDTVLDSRNRNTQKNPSSYLVLLKEVAGSNIRDSEFVMDGAKIALYSLKAAFLVQINQPMRNTNIEVSNSSNVTIFSQIAETRVFDFQSVTSLTLINCSVLVSGGSIFSSKSENAASIFMRLKAVIGFPFLMDVADTTVLSTGPSTFLLTLQGTSLKNAIIRWTNSSALLHAANSGGANIAFRVYGKSELIGSDFSLLNCNLTMKGIFNNGSVICVVDSTVISGKTSGSSSLLIQGSNVTMHGPNSQNLKFANIASGSKLKSSYVTFNDSSLTAQGSTFTHGFFIATDVVASDSVLCILGSQMTLISQRMRIFDVLATTTTKLGMRMDSSSVILAENNGSLAADYIYGVRLAQEEESKDCWVDIRNSTFAMNSSLSGVQLIRLEEGNYRNLSVTIGDPSSGISGRMGKNFISISSEAISGDMNLVMTSGANISDSSFHIARSDVEIRNVNQVALNLLSFSGGEWNRSTVIWQQNRVFLYVVPDWTDVKYTSIWISFSSMKMNVWNVTLADSIFDIMVPKFVGIYFGSNSVVHSGSLTMQGIEAKVNPNYSGKLGCGKIIRLRSYEMRNVNFTIVNSQFELRSHENGPYNIELYGVSVLNNVSFFIEQSLLKAVSVNASSELVPPTNIKLHGLVGEVENLEIQIHESQFFVEALAATPWNILFRSIPQGCKNCTLIIDGSFFNVSLPEAATAIRFRSVNFSGTQFTLSVNNTSFWFQNNSEASEVVSFKACEISPIFTQSLEAVSPSYFTIITQNVVVHAAVRLFLIESTNFLFNGTMQHRSIGQVSHSFFSYPSVFIVNNVSLWGYSMMLAKRPALISFLNNASCRNMSFLVDNVSYSVRFARQSSVVRAYDTTLENCQFAFLTAKGKTSNYVVEGVMLPNPVSVDSSSFFRVVNSFVSNCNFTCDAAESYTAVVDFGNSPHFTFFALGGTTNISSSKISVSRIVFRNNETFLDHAMGIHSFLYGFLSHINYTNAFTLKVSAVSVVDTSLELDELKVYVPVQHIMNLRGSLSYGGNRITISKTRIFGVGFSAVDGNASIFSSAHSQLFEDNQNSQLPSIYGSYLHVTLFYATLLKFYSFSSDVLPLTSQVVAECSVWNRYPLSPFHLKGSLTDPFYFGNFSVSNPLQRCDSLTTSFSLTLSATSSESHSVQSFSSTSSKSATSSATKSTSNSRSLSQHSVSGSHTSSISSSLTGSQPSLSKTLTESIDPCDEFRGSFPASSSYLQLPPGVSPALLGVEWSYVPSAVFRNISATSGAKFVPETPTTTAPPPTSNDTVPVSSTPVPIAPTDIAHSILVSTVGKMSLDNFLATGYVNFTLYFLPRLKVENTTTGLHLKVQPKASFGFLSVVKVVSEHVISFVIDAPEPGLILLHEENTLTISLELDGAFVCQNMSSTAFTHFNLSIIISPLPSPVSAKVTKALDITAMSTAGMSGALGNPTLALQQSRIMALASLGECFFSHVESLPTSMNPLKFGFGHPVGFYYRGAVFGNLALFAVIVAFFGLLAVILYLVLFCRYRRNRSAQEEGASRQRVFKPSLARCFATLHFPSILMVPVALLYQSMATVSVALLLHSPHQPITASSAGVEDLIIGIVGLLIVSFFLLFVAIKTTLGFPLILGKRLAEEPSETPKSCFALLSDALFNESHHWVADTDNATIFKQQYLLFILDYRISYFICVEVVVSLLMGAIEGIRESKQSVCVMQSVAFVVINFIALIVSCLGRPALALFQQIFLVLVFLVGVVCSLCILAYLLTQNETWNKFGSYSATILLMVGLLKFVVDISVALRWANEKRNRLTNYLLKGGKKFFVAPTNEFSENEMALLTVTKKEGDTREELGLLRADTEDVDEICSTDTIPQEAVFSLPAATEEKKECGDFKEHRRDPDDIAAKMERFMNSHQADGKGNESDAEEAMLHSLLQEEAATTATSTRATVNNRRYLSNLDDLDNFLQALNDEDIQSGGRSHPRSDATVNLLQAATSTAGNDEDDEALGQLLLDIGNY